MKLFENSIGVPEQETFDYVSDADLFPSEVWLLVYANKKVGGYYFAKDNLHGIACFSTEENAVNFATHIKIRVSVSAVKYSLEDAVAKARERKQECPNLACLFLMDGDFNNPTATYWL